MKNNEKITKTNKPKALVVLLHGFGGNGDDISSALNALQQQFPSFIFVAPNGNFHLKDDAYAWVNLRMPFSWQQLEKGIPTVAPIVHQYVKTELDKLNLTYEQLILVGFSQGALVALEVGLTSPVSPKAVIMLSGFYAVPESLEKARAKPPVYLLAGENDNVMNKEQAEATATLLSEADVDVKTFLFSGLGHRIDRRVVETISDILKTKFSLKYVK